MDYSNIGPGLRKIKPKDDNPELRNFNPKVPEYKAHATIATFNTMRTTFPAHD
jgi:hypothetical protein